MVVVPGDPHIAGNASLIALGGKMPSTDDPKLLTPHEVAELLRVKISTIYSAASTGKLPAVRLWRGKRKSLLRFKRSEIERLIALGDGDQRQAVGFQKSTGRSGATR